MYLRLKRASASRPSGEWNTDDFDVVEDDTVVGRIFKANAAPAATPPSGSHANARVCGEPRGGDGCIRQELATGIGTSGAALCCRTELAAARSARACLSDLVLAAARIPSSRSTAGVSSFDLPAGAPPAIPHQGRAIFVQNTSRVCR
jgi:hypothetical protein